MTRLLITAGPTHEPIDAVRYLGNRSSGRLGVKLADEASRRGWDVTLLLGPTPMACESTQVATHRFRTTADLQGLLSEHAPQCDVLVMAAAVADYRPIPPADVEDVERVKIRRTPGRMTLDLEATPDLLAEAASKRRPGQLFVGFALEPAATLLDSGKAKLVRKGLDLLVANPLDTMDAAGIHAWLLAPAGVIDETPGSISKAAFASWLLDHIAAKRSDNAQAGREAASTDR